jgi:hypothetical protein
LAQGYKVSEEEQKKILELHQNGYFPVVIARHLSDRYAHLNGGYRSPETVKDTIKMLEERKVTAGEYFPSQSPDLSQPKEPVKKLPDMRKGNGKKEVKDGRSVQTKTPKTA